MDRKELMSNETLSGSLIQCMTSESLLDYVEYIWYSHHGLYQNYATRTLWPVAQAIYRELMDRVAEEHSARRHVATNLDTPIMMVPVRYLHQSL